MDSRYQDYYLKLSKFYREPSTAIFKYQNNKSLSSYKGYEIRALGDYAQWLNSLEK